MPVTIKVKKLRNFYDNEQVTVPRVVADQLKLIAGKSKVRWEYEIDGNKVTATIRKAR